MEIVPLTEGEKTGAEARQGGTRVAHLVGALGEAPSRGKHVWVGLDDHSLAPGTAPELLADVYAVAGGPWVADGYLTHIVVVLADGPLPALFFRLGFGQEQVHATGPTLEHAPPEPQGFTIRQAAPTDLERVLDVAGTISSHQAGAPVWAGLPVSVREDMRDDWEELLAEEGAVVLLAERDGETLGYVATYAGDEPGLAHLPVAGTGADARGGGIGVALVEHALHRAHRDGMHSVALDWRSTNLLASRFWPKRGFVPTHLRLRRDVQPAA
ncbi:MAG TPA: GNAT family N-acetyltransferase [Gaiellaceae bacterium]|nr:GNAT family N-acetyltransferase [Gaiellaceae bacterium]